MRGGSTAERRTVQTTGPASETPQPLALNARLVRERDRDRARELARTLALGVAVLLPLLLHVWQQVAYLETAYGAEALRSERDHLAHLLREVRMERSALESLDRIESEARRRLELLHPPPEAVVTVQPLADTGRAPEAEAADLSPRGATVAAVGAEGGLGG